MSSIFSEKRDKPFLIHTDNVDFKPHIHEETELIFIEKGCGTAYCDGIKYELGENTFFIVFPYQVHSYCDFGKDTLAYTLIVKPDFLYDYVSVFSAAIPISPVFRYNKEDSDGIVSLLRLAEKNKNDDTKVLSSLLTAVFGLLLKHYTITKDKKLNASTEKILHYCKQNYTGDISLDSVAKALNISRSSVTHIFSDRLHIGFLEYVNSLRISQAARLLDDSSKTITEISDMVGFSTIRTFNRIFSKKTGMTPSKYRKYL